MKDPAAAIPDENSFEYQADVSMKRVDGAKAEFVSPLFSLSWSWPTTLAGSVVTLAQRVLQN